MMFRYLGSGPRKYGNRPLRNFTRPHYEIQAVLDGRIACSITGQPPYPQERQAWVFEPGFEHGWTGIPDEEAEVAVFHVPEVDEPLRELVADKGFWSTALDRQQVNGIRRLIHRAEAIRRHPHPLNPLKNREVLVDLSLLLLKNEDPLPMRRNSDQERVENAVQWFEANLQYAPTIGEVAEAVGCSVATLRRSFTAVHRASPQTVLDRSRFAQARSLLLPRGPDVAAVAQACGYGSAAAFSRAFKRHSGRSPEAFRHSGT